MAKTYDTYKDSGIAWIGNIPSGWSTIKNKYLYSLVYSGGTPTASEGKFYTEEGCPFVAISDMSTTEYVTETKKHLTEDGIANKNLKILPSGTILYSIYATVGVVSELMIDATISQAMLAIELKSKINKSYYKYNLKAMKDYIFSQANGNTQFNLNAEKVSNFVFCFPPLSEQQAIATYLNKKCGEIDSLISLQEEMISELQAYKQSVITEAVTKGLDPNVPMKDSGVEWIGEIPNGWKVMPIRSLFDKRKQKNNPIISKERLSLSIGVGITKYADKTTNLDRFKDDFTAYQLAYKDDIVLNSMNMIVGAVGKSDFIGCVSPVYYVITAKQNVSPDFYAYSLNTPKIRDVYHSLGRGIYAIERGDGRVNTCRLKVPYYDFSIINMPVPPLSEQQAIASYLDEKTSKIDSLIALKQEKITELKDYKKSIIYEYVTGKKKV